MCTHIYASIFVTAAYFAIGCLMIMILSLDLFSPSSIKGIHELKV